ncbi:hypothetical protein V5799_003284 [Amblyomma americanum]|uniref:Uncharacterized protein n=1 Tax=Amblyomma americanum TaxID=6943 RepID=A0AAQ4D9E4_AMBAM
MTLKIPQATAILLISSPANSCTSSGTETASSGPLWSHFLSGVNYSASNAHTCFAWFSYFSHRELKPQAQARQQGQRVQARELKPQAQARQQGQRAQARELKPQAQAREQEQRVQGR